MTHTSHKTRFSDASTFDEICIYCGATDTQGSDLLNKPCTRSRVKKEPSPPMDEITIAGYVFAVPSPYAEGHVCNKAEADVLNRKLHANLRANFAKQMEQYPGRGRDTPEATLHADFAAYASTYSLGGPDPTDSEAHTIALGIVRRAIKDSDRNLSNYSKAQLNQQADDLLLGPLGGEIKRLARERVTTLHKAAQAELNRVKGG